MKATAQANTNIALIKYWGKRDEMLFLPMNSSISITLDHFYTETTVEYQEDLKSDVFTLDGIHGSEAELRKISKFMDKIRLATGTTLYAKITSQNHVPTAAGFASSASGYAALTAAAVKATGIEFNKQELSRLARQGSGSACRSIEGGFVLWDKGSREDGLDSFGVQLRKETEWDISILSAVVDRNKKAISSREGMKRTVETSPFYSGWLNSIDQDIKTAKEAILEKDIYKLGEVMESNALKMHGTMMGAFPPVIYWNGGTMSIMNLIQELRGEGIPAYFTIDAGANVKILTLPSYVELVKEQLDSIPEVRNVILCNPGPGVEYIL